MAITLLNSSYRTAVINMICYQLLLVLPFIYTISADYMYDVKYLTVPVDHFSFCNNNTFKLRYLINDSYWTNEGPIFLYTGNEGSIHMFAQNTGFVWEIASEFHALIVFAEHRYYGDSKPFGNLSFSAPEYLGYLTSTQALADFVYLIDYIQVSSDLFKEEGIRNPVIAFGGSYGGMLSAWLRMKYPASVVGAIASSAPILQFGQLVPCDIFNRIVTSVYRATSTECANIIESSWDALMDVLSTKDGKIWLSDNWKLCIPLETDDDVQRLIDWIEEVYGNMAMVNYPYPTDFFINLPAYPVRKFCKLLQLDSNTPSKLLIQLGKALNVYTNNTGTAECVNTLSNSTKLGELGWEFQACTELIMPMCSKESDMFINANWNFTEYSELCFNKWRIKVNNEKQPILEYGGRNMNSASNIIFSNGLLDPWSGGGVLQNISKTVIAYVIPDAAHHLDLRGYNPRDPPSILAARHFYKRVVDKWLRDYYIEYLNENFILSDA